MVRTREIRERWLVLLLILIGLGLRLYRVDYPDITGDEAWSVTIAGWQLEDIIASDVEFNPPFYHLLLYGMMRLGGDTALVIRYVSVLAGLMGVVLLGRLGWLVGGSLLGLWTLIVGVFSPFLIYYAQEARFYGVVFATSTASLTLLVYLLRQQVGDKIIPGRVWLLYGLASSLMLFSHYYAFAMMVCQAGFVVLFHAWRRSWKQLRGWVAVWFGMAVAFLPWLVYSVDFLNTRTYQQFDKWRPAVWFDLAQRTLRAYSASITLPSNLTWISWLVVGLAVLGALTLWRYRSPQRYLAVLPVIIVLGVISFAWGMNPIVPFFYERYLMVGTPAFLLLVSAGIWGMIRLHRVSGIVALLLFLSVAGTSLSHQWFDPAFLKGSYGRLMSDIEQRSLAGDLVLLNNPLQQSLADIYLPEQLSSKMLDRAQLLSTEETGDYIKATTAGYDRVWLVEYGNPAAYDPSHRVLQWLGQNGSRAYYANYINSGPIYLFILGDATDGDQRKVGANFNDEISLTTARLPASIRSGEPLLLELLWQAQVALDRDYTVFTHLLDGEGLLVAQTDGQPGGGARPTSGWQPGEVVTDKYAILVPDTLTPGVYQVRVGMYLWPELTRVPVISSLTRVIDNTIDLGPVRVE